MTLTKTVLTAAVVSLSLVALAGCEQEKTQEWYMDHHDELLKKYAQCLNNETFTTEDCAPVVKAQRSLMGDPEVAKGIKAIDKKFVEGLEREEKSAE